MKIAWPYGRYRTGQREASEKILSALEEGKVIALNAPTGFGKTITVLFPAIQYALDNDLKILYLVRTRNEIEPVLRELFLLVKNTGIDIDFRYSILLGKRRTCYFNLVEGLDMLDHDYEDFAQVCRYMRRKGQCPLKRIEYTFFRKTDEAIQYILAQEACPWYVLTLWSQESDTLVGTYPYLFNPFIRNSFLEEYGVLLDSTIVVVDEAHNLDSILQNADRKLSLRTVGRAINDTETYGNMLPATISEETRRQLNLLVKFMRNNLSDSKLKKIGVEKFIAEVLDNVDLELLEDFSKKMLELKLRLEGLRSRCYICSVYRFLTTVKKMWLEGGDVELFANKNRLELKALVPSMVTYFLNKAYSTIFSSGTLPPREYIIDMYGIEREIEYIEIKGFYRPTQVKYFIGLETTSKYTERSLTNFMRIGFYILKIRSLIDPDYVVLTVYPSYEFMKRVLEVILFLEKKYDFNFTHIVEEKETTLGKVEEAVKKKINVILHGVSGGKLTEGVELKKENGESLIRAIVIAGLPFPEPNDYLEARLEKYSEIYGKEKAWEYLMMIPMAIRVKQAIGRAVRGPEDQALFFILDRRTLSRKILALLSIEKYKKVYLPSKFRRMTLILVEEFKKQLLTP
ncbi:MAG: hypothetical protein DRJ47_05835 [Thermoprotei archaeon]|nr:MAG: hypothetical protein DRJ47_05835 [Thermoprotei archaeon]